jgi:hypothetical protein
MYNANCLEIRCIYPVLSIAWVHNYNPNLYSPLMHEGRPPGPCINCKRKDVTTRYWHLSEARATTVLYLSKMHMHSKMITVFVECVRLYLENHSKCPTIQKQHQANENSHRYKLCIWNKWFKFINSKLWQLW